MLSLSKSLQVFNADFYDRGFRRTIEDHLDTITNYATKNMVIDGAQAIAHKGDFFGLMRKLRVKPDLWWATMRVNGLQSPMEYTEEMLVLTSVNEDAYSKVLQVWRNMSNAPR